TAPARAGHGSGQSQTRWNSLSDGDRAGGGSGACRVRDSDRVGGSLLTLGEVARVRFGNADLWGGTSGQQSEDADAVGGSHIDLAVDHSRHDELVAVAE